MLGREPHSADELLMVYAGSRATMLRTPLIDL
jgi:hypothetical protein